MRYSYTFRNTTADFLLFRLGNTYTNWTGAINVIWTGVFAVLLFTQWNHTNTTGKILLLLGFLLFLVIQPCVMAIVGHRQAKKIPVDTTVTFDEKGMQIEVEKHLQRIPWKEIYPMVKRRSMLIAAPDGIHAYLLTNRILGDDKEALYAFHEEMVQKYSKYKDVGKKAPAGEKQ